MATTPSALDACQPWQTPELTGLNRLAGRATLWPYADAPAALAGTAPIRQCLDGDWRFTLVERPEATPATVMDPDFDDHSWDRLPVPGLWTMHGHGRPHYTNWRLPFTPVDSPRVPAANPTGLYRQHFTVPSAWRGRRIVLHFDGLEAGCSSLWINGRPAGIIKDSRLPSAFDITALVGPGRNLLTLQCITWADTTYIEDQDHWRQYGISRSVFLYATGPAFIEDLFCRADYDPASGAGRLAVDLRLGGAGGPGFSFRVHLHDQRGKALGKQPRTADIPWGLEGHKRQREPIGELVIDLPRVSPWSHETPRLYTVVAELIDPQGRVVETTRTHIGFRRVEIRDRELRLNGRMVYIYGVNRHDHHDRTGKVIDRDTMLADLRQMKAHHINAIRCSHYPNDPLFLDLCDELGFLVIDEADIECHHTYARTPHDPRYALAFLDRGMRMVLRDRNHPSIIAWSLGNESGYGPNQDAMAGWIRHADPSRPLHCEGAICRANSDWDRGHAATDMICPMYPSIDSIVAWATTTTDHRPFIMCEYSHAMGNSNGSLADYWAAIRAHHGLQGGFIWEWIDHGLVKTSADGREYWAYGGDFGDFPNDADFVCDGLVWPDRTPHPALTECRRLFQPLEAELLADGRRIRVTSRYDFLRSTHLDGRWILRADGQEQARGRLPRLDLAPGDSALLTLPGSRRPGGDHHHLDLPLPRRADGREWHLDLLWHDRRDQPLLGRGHLAAEVQLSLPLAAAAPRLARPRPAGTPRLEISRSEQAWQLVAGDSHITIAAATGALDRWQVDGRDLLGDGLLPTIWRAPTENDGVRAWHFHVHDDQPPSIWDKALRRWSRQGLDTCTTVVDSLRLTRRADGGAGLRARLRIHGRDPALAIREDRLIIIRPDGSLEADHRFTVPAALADLPRLGVWARTASDLTDLDWFGHGPGESYSDRCLGTPLGRWHSSVAERYVPYILPQEHGNIHGLRWLALRADDGFGLMAGAPQPICGKATLISDACLTAARHTTDVAWEPAPILHLDLAQRGLGTGSCGPDTLPHYRITAGRHRLIYHLLPLRPGDNPGQLYRGG